jgi:hypothetical protein
MSLVERIRTILNGSVGLQRDFSTIANGDDLYDAGMTSHSTIAEALKEAGVRKLVA